MYYTAKFRERLSHKGAGQHLCLRLLAGRSVWSGTSFAGCRSGCRCARDLLVFVSLACGSPRTADGGTVGGGADRVVWLCSRSRLSSRPLTFQFLRVVVVVIVFKIVSQDGVQQAEQSGALTFTFVEAFTVFSQDRDRRSVL